MTFAGEVLLNISDYAIIIPGMLMCLIPVREDSRLPWKKFFSVFFALVSVSCIFMGFIDSYFDIDPIIFSVLFLVVALPLYFCAFKTDKSKLLYLFVSAAASLSFGGLASHIFSAVLFPESSILESNIYGSLAQWIITAVILAIFMPLLINKLNWVLKNFNSKKSWLLASTAPFIIILANIVMIPRDYHTMSVGRAFEVYVIIEVVFIVVFFTFQFMFYRVAKSSYDKYEADYLLSLADMQKSEYESLQSYLENSAQIRHDFRQTVRTIAELLENNYTDEAKLYISEYMNKEQKRRTVYKFCKHTAANAILGYYYSTSLESEIKINIRADIPKDIPVNDSDICILIGNLLENAIKACLILPKEERSINLSVDNDDVGELYIMQINSFNGRYKKQDGRFISTKKDGSGIGLNSVTAIANKYNGTADFQADGKEFISSVMLKF